MPPFFGKLRESGGLNHGIGDALPATPLHHVRDGFSGNEKYGQIGDGVNIFDMSIDLSTVQFTPFAAYQVNRSFETEALQVFNGISAKIIG